MPDNYIAFTPPGSEGGAYVDSTFGTTVRRISKATNYAGASGIGNEWSAANAINADGTLIFGTDGTGGHRLWWYLGGPAGIAQGLAHDNLYEYEPFPYLLSGQIRWHPTDPHKIIYVSPEAAYYTGADVAGPSYIKQVDLVTGAPPTILHTFASYANLYFTSADLSPDGDYLPILANGRYIFWYRISTDTVGPIVNATDPSDSHIGIGMGVGDKGGCYVVGDRFVKFNYPPPNGTGTNYQFPFGLLVMDRDTMTLVSSSFTDASGSHTGIITEIDHAAYGLDTDGTTPIAIMPGASRSVCTVNPYYPNTYSILKWDLHAGGLPTVLLCAPTEPNRNTLPARTDIYFSMAPLRPGWVLTTHVSDNVDGVGWVPFENEIFWVKTDGSGTVKRVAHTRGVPNVNSAYSTTMTVTGLANTTSPVTFTVSSDDWGIPTPFDVMVEHEIIRVTSKSGTSWTATRGICSTTPTSHANGTPIYAPSISYGARAKTAVSRDGTACTFGSNMNQWGPSPTGDFEYQDLYFIAGISPTG